MSDTAVPASDPPLPAATDEDSGRLSNASTGRLIAVLVTLVLFAEVVPFQYTMIGVIVPKIGASFPASGNSVSWVLTILGVVGAASMALVGKASDLFGKKNTLLAVSVFFLIGTVVCALTSSWALFLVGRGLEALSLGMSAITYSAIRDLFPRRWVPICVGITGTGLGMAGIAAPLIGGVLTDHYSWRAIFWFLVIYMIVVIPLLVLIVPDAPFRVKQRFDVVGALLFGLGIGGALIYLSEGASWGWGSIGCLSYLIGGAVLLVAFLAWESRISYPMMELSLLRAPKVSMIMALALFGTITLAISNFVVPYMFETPKPKVLEAQILAGVAAKQHYPVSVISQFVHFQGDISYAGGFSVFQLAWHIVIFTSVSGMIFGPVGGILARRFGSRLPLLIGSVALVISFLLWWQLHKTWQEQASIGILWGLGFGFYYAASPNLLIDAVPAERQGISSGMLAVFGSVGGALATALATPILSSHPLQLVANNPVTHQTVVQAIPQVYTDAGYSQVYLLVGVIAAVITLALAILLRSGRTPARGGAAVEAHEAPAPAAAGA